MMRRILIVAFFLARAMTAPAQSARAPEYEVKAAFLYNFAKFVEWPTQAFPSSSAPLRICVLGRDPFGDTLDRIVQGKSISGRPIVTRQVQSPLEARACHILFFSRSDAETLKQELAHVRDLPVLAVGEHEGFLLLGGIINFVIDQDRVRFEVNLEAAEHHRLKISSKLLAVARVVDVGGGNE
jgi:hypothetical protein